MKKDSYYEQYALICKSIINPIRLQIIDVINNQKLNVTQIQEELDISMSNLSNHLNALYRIGVLNREKKGNFIYYSLTNLELLEVMEKMKSVFCSILSQRNQIILESKNLRD